MQKKFKQFISEGYTFGPKTEEELDGVDVNIGNDKLIDLFRHLRKEFPSVDQPLAIDLGSGQVKTRLLRSDFDPWEWSSEKYGKAFLKKDVAIGKGSVGKKQTTGVANAAEWEQVICVCYNMRSKGVDLTKAKELAGVENSWVDRMDAGLPTGFKIVDDAFPNPKDVMQHFGSDAVNLTREWNQYFIKMTGKSAPNPTKTPKTDMYIGDIRISLKQDGGSQFMSGGAPETLATLAFAYDALPLSMKTREFENAWKEIESDIETKFTKVNIGDRGTIRNVRKDIKSGIEDDVTKLVSEAIANHEMMQEAIIDIFESLEARKALVYESMTGANKFADKKAIASHVMIFNEMTGKAKLKKIDDSLVEGYARAISFQINFKKGGSSSIPYSNLRIALGKMKSFFEEYDIDDELDHLFEEEIHFDNEMLEEAMLGRVGKAIKNFIKRTASKLWRKMKRVASKTFDGLQKITGRTITVTDPKFTWKL